MATYYVSSGEVSSGIELANSTMYICSGGVANSTTVNGGGYLCVSNGGVANSTTVNIGGYFCVSNGGVANSTTVNDGGNMYIASGGVANSNTVNRGYLNVSNGGTADSTTLNSGGALRIYQGGVANHITVNSGSELFLKQGGEALNVVWTPCVGYVNVPEGAIITFANDYNGVYFGLNDQLLSSGLTITGETLSGHSMYVMNGGTANKTAVNDNGSMCVWNGGAATSTAVNSRGFLSVEHGGTATSTAVNSGGVMYVNSGGMVNSTAVNSSGYLCISNGGTALNVVWTPCVGSITVYDGATVTFASNYEGVYLGSDNRLLSSALTMTGKVLAGHSLYVMNRGEANSTTVSRYGSMYVNSGGTANSTTVNSYGYLYVSSGGTATIVFNPWQGSIYSSAGATVTYLERDANIYYGNNGSIAGKWDILNNFAVSGGCSAIVYSGGTANSTTVSRYGSMCVNSGGVANDTAAVNGGRVLIFKGGKHTGVLSIANGAVVSAYAGSIIDFDISVVAPGDAARINNWALIQGIPNCTITVSATQNEGTYILAYGAASFNRTITVVTDAGTELGTITVGEELAAGGYTYLLGLDAGALSLTVSSSGPVVIDDMVLANSSFMVSSAVIVNRTTVNNSGFLSISSGGVANSTTVNRYGSMYVFSGGTATIVFNPWQGTVNSAAGATVTYLERDANIYYGSNGDLVGKWDALNSFAVSSGCSAIVYSGGTANSTTVNSRGYLCVFSGGVANSTTVNQVGHLYVFSGGVANDTTVNHGIMYVSSGGKVTGTLTVADGAVVSAYAGSIIDFDISGVAPGDAARINNWSLIQGNSDYTITVSATQAEGTYILAEGAAGFGETITVNNNNGTELGTIIAGGELAAGGYTYSLDLDAGALSLTVAMRDMIPPEKPTVSASTTALTNQDVTVTATFAVDSVLNEYSFNDGVWTEYSVGIVFTDNGSVSFRSTDAAGNISEITEYTVSNIDKVAPANPTASASTTAPTNQDVTVTAAYSSDSARKQYSLDGETWNIYTAGVVFTDNGTVYFRGIDEAGNVSDVTSYEVSNIDRIAPVITVTGDNISAVHQTTLAAVVDDGSVLYYRVNGGAWIVYAAPITVEANAVYDFEATDAAGNVGNASIAFANILPEIPENLSGTTDALSWSPTGAEQYIVEYSTDNFEHVVGVAVSRNGLDSLALPSGNYQWRVKGADDDNFVRGTDISAPAAADAPQVVQAVEDGVADLIFGRANGVWERNKAAMHLGCKDGWKGTQELVSLDGKGKIADLYFGSEDANVLFLTDSANGDALFVDDVFTALPGSITEQRSRIARINEIRAGAGDDVVDMTSRRFEYTGNGVTVRGGLGDDVIWANKGDNFLFGDSGNDRLVGALGNDVLAGGDGNDRMHGGGGNDLFTFGENWGNDTVEQLASGTVTLWFASGAAGNWNAATLTYTDGVNSVTVSGISADKVTLKFGDDGSEQYAALSAAGAFAEYSSENIFEERGKGILATL